MIPSVKDQTKLFRDVLIHIEGVKTQEASKPKIDGEFSMGELMEGTVRRQVIKLGETNMELLNQVAFHIDMPFKAAAMAESQQKAQIWLQGKRNDSKRLSRS